MFLLPQYDGEMGISAFTVRNSLFQVRLSVFLMLSATCFGPEIFGYQEQKAELA